MKTLKILLFLIPISEFSILYNLPQERKTKLISLLKLQGIVWDRMVPFIAPLVSVGKVANNKRSSGNDSWKILRKK